MNESPKETCWMCHKKAALSQSHILPKFVFRWLKESGGTDYLRFGANPNRRVQDGLKLPLLCAECETLLSGTEKVFAERVFKFVVKESYPRGTYFDWYSRFVASVLWRVGASQQLRGVLKNAPSEHQTQIEAALSTWRRFVLNQVSNPGQYELHAVPIGGLSSMNHSRLPSNWNRYTLRHVEFDTVFTESGSFLAIYAKLGPIAFFGHASNKIQKWHGSRIAVNHGQFSTPKLVWPPFLLEFFFSRASGADTLSRSISDKQKGVTEKEILRNLGRVANSQMFEALLRDAEQFGIDAVVHNRNPAENLD